MMELKKLWVNAEKCGALEIAAQKRLKPSLPENTLTRCPSLARPAPAPLQPEHAHITN
jgi:hypothetical protein